MSVAGWGCPRVEISMAELRSQDNGQLSQRLRMDPLRHLRALEAACHSIANEERPGYDKDGKKKKRMIMWSSLRFKHHTRISYPHISYHTHIPYHTIP
jgi:hypothetical protein